MVFRKLADDDFFGLSKEEVAEALKWKRNEDVEFKSEKGIEFKPEKDKWIGNEQLFRKIYEKITNYIHTVATHSTLKRTSSDQLYEYLLDYVTDKMMRYYNPNLKPLKPWISYITIQGKIDYMKEYESGDSPNVISIDENEMMEEEGSEANFQEILEDPRAWTMMNKPVYSKLIDKIRESLRTVVVDKMTTVLWWQHRKKPKGLTENELHFYAKRQLRGRLVRTFNMLVEGYNLTEIIEEVYDGQSNVFYRALNNYIIPIVQSKKDMLLLYK